MSNWVAARAIGSENPLLDTIIVALVSGYALRNHGNASGDATIHNTSLQLMTSFTTVLSVLGCVAWVSHKIPLLSDSATVVYYNSFRLPPVILVVSVDRMDIFAAVSAHALAFGWHKDTRYRSFYHNKNSYYFDVHLVIEADNKLDSHRDDCSPVA